jgi:hypothetical protein
MLQLEPNENRAKVLLQIAAWFENCETIIQQSVSCIWFDRIDVVSEFFPFVEEMHGKNGEWNQRGCWTWRWRNGGCPDREPTGQLVTGDHVRISRFSRSSSSWPTDHIHPALTLLWDTQYNQMQMFWKRSIRVLLIWTERSLWFTTAQIPFLSFKELFLRLHLFTPKLL